MRRWFMLLILFAMPVLACNLSVGSTETDEPPTAAPTDLPGDGTTPNVVIESPATGSQAVVNQRLVVKVRATDSVGVSRIIMSESGRTVTIQSPESPVTDFEVLLPYNPSNVGAVTLEVTAYRRNGVASSPASITLEIVRTEAELISPIDPTLGVAAGAACSAQVKVSNLNIRTGPGRQHQSLGKLDVGEQLSIIGRNADFSWYQVKRTNGMSGWVSADYLLTNGDCSKAPFVAG
jgi:hypothetical protein